MKKRIRIYTRDAGDIDNMVEYRTYERETRSQQECNDIELVDNSTEVQIHTENGDITIFSGFKFIYNEYKNL